jgi:hypothetical protein
VGEGRKAARQGDRWGVAGGGRANESIGRIYANIHSQYSRQMESEVVQKQSQRLGANT